MFQQYHDLCDVVSLLVQCFDDNTFLIIQDAHTQEYWIPSAKVGEKKSWRCVAKSLLQEIGLSGKINKTCQIVRVWNPSRKEMLYHVVYFIKIAKDTKQHFRSSGGQRSFWVITNEIQTYYEKLRSPELLDYISSVQGTLVYRQKKAAQWMSNLSPWSSLLEIEDINETVEILEHHVFLRNEPTHKKVMDSAGFTETIQASIFCKYLVYCFPCTYMNIRIFGNILQQLGWEKGNIPQIFSTADVEARGFLSYRDFLYMIAVAEPNMKHGVGASEIRSRYIFRYYDVKNDQLLDYDELKALYQDVRGARSKTPETALLARDLEACALALGVDARQPTDSEHFVRTLATPRLRGASVLLRSFRSFTSLAPALQDDAAARAPPALLASKSSAHSSTLNSSRQVADYGVATHCVKLRKNGTAVEKIWNLEGAMSATSLSMSKNPLSNSPSMEFFNHTNVHFEVLRGLEYFEKEVTAKEAAQKPGKRAKAAFTWGLVEPQGFARCLMRVCNAVAPVLRAEPRLLEICSPVYVLGDLHGSFSDLIHFEKALWPLGPTLSPTVLLVLGDYVDRGPHSVEIVAYLFAYKLQAPHKVMLLRGNHEIREVQRLFTFHKECCHKFGEKLGHEVWEAVNQAMDCLPLAAVVDGKVLCVHGGIPPPWLCPTVAAVNSVPCPLPRPDLQSPLAWDLMWNDPVPQGEPSAALQLELSANEGFAANAHRGTGHFFTADALAAFLRANGLSMMLRAHQMNQNGFFVQMRHQMETVFSASNYGNANNDAACVLVECGRLRAFRVEVSQCRPPSPV